MSSEEQRPRAAGWNTLVMGLIGAALLSYAVYRASVASFTHDESYSYLSYPHQSVRDILTMRETFTNNHVLNSLGMKYADACFGDSELALRSPNLLLFALYLTYAFLLCRSFGGWASVCAFILLAVNSQILVLFSLARGYGLSFGFMLMALFHLIQALRSMRIRHVVLFHIACILAVLSNFTMLDLYAAGMATYVLVLLLGHRFQKLERPAVLRNVMAHAVMLAVGILLLWIPVSRVVENNLFDFGGKTGFYDTTARSVVYAAFPAIVMNEERLVVFDVIITAVVAFALFVMIRRTIRGDHDLLRSDLGLVVGTLLLLLVCMATVAQHLLFGTDFLESRFAVFLMPLFWFVVVALLYRGWSLAGGRVATVVGTGLAALSVYGTVVTSDARSTAEWFYDSETLNALRTVEQDRRSMHPPADTVRIGITWYFEPTITFYQRTRHMDRLAPVHRQGFSADDDYRYIFIDDPDRGDTLGYERIATFPRASSVLYRRK